MQARYYDPVIGRFYGNDPVGYTGEIDTFNRYSYVANNPYKYADPNGKSKKFVAESVKIVGSGIKSLGKVTMQTAIKIRKAGGDLRSQSASQARKIERAAFPGNSQTRPEQHQLESGEMGELHIHTKKDANGKKRMPGHHFIASAASGVAAGFESIGGALESAGNFMENIEQNMPTTMETLSILDPISNAEEAMQTLFPTEDLTI